MISYLILYEVNKMKHRIYGPYEAFFKRIIDIMVSIIVMIAFCWLYVFVAILVRVKLGSPVLFVQERPGKNEEIFKMYKFRSMSDARDEKGNLLPDSARLTKFGKMLRRTSLDELPEIVNILKGDMSIIGPRPLLVSYLPYYTEREKHRHDVRPGLTGLAQVNGRNYLDWDTRFELDVQYVEKITFVGDIKIIFMTMKNILSHNDVAEYTYVTEGNMAEMRAIKKMKENSES